MNRDPSNGGKLAEHRSAVTSNALNTADMQFSSYVLNESQDTTHNTFSYSPAVNISMLDNGGNHCNSFAGNRILRGLGAADSQPFSGNAFGNRSTIPMSSSGSHPISYTGAPGVSSFSCAESSRASGHGGYASLLNKANLLFENNLDSMMVDWTLEEQECRRRLVQFWRRHENNNIFCTFKSVAAADRVPNSIVVSCIYWEERQDFFITSVDCIHLLESLIAVRFTVEEKNRIRRNLEGFRPLTVSKCKADSIDFFKLIMSFPNPKPRNIEKDVKVFPWRILPLALKKIIGKYTASYSSTSSITLDTYSTPRVTSYSQLVGIPPPSGSGGMAAFNSQSPISSIFGSSSASAAVVAAAAASVSASACASATSRYTPGTSISPSGGVSSGLKSRQTPSAAGFDNIQMLYGGSSLMPDLNTCITAGTQGSLDANNVHASGGRLSIFNGSSNSGNNKSLEPEQHLAVAPANQSNTNKNYQTSAVNPILGFSENHHSGCLSSASGTTGAPAPATTFAFSESMANGQNNCQTSVSRKPPLHGLSNVSSEYLMLSGDQLQFDFAGMATNHSLSSAESVECLDQNTTDKEPVPATESVSASLCSVADYGFTLADYGLSVQQHKPQQRVARSQSTKKLNPRVPYNVDRADRRRGAAASTNSERGVDDGFYSESPSRVATSFSNSSGTGQNADREASPSIPLILEQQCHDVSLGCLGTPTQMTLSSSMLLSGISGVSANGCSAFNNSGSVIKGVSDSNHAFDPLYNILSKALKDSSKSSNSSNSGDTIFKSESPDANRTNDTATSSTPIEIDPFSGSDMFKFPMGNDSENSEFNLLADLISASSSQGSGTHSSPGLQ
ncbi:hypothetical protein LPJ57_003593, partial [Coemansia sp. RSA 486]